MQQLFHEIKINTKGQGFYDFTDKTISWINGQKIKNGILNINILHTSASLVIQENADPSARRDLEQWLNRLVAEDDPLYTHTLEGPDDMPAHIKAALTSTTLSIPVQGGRPALGVWQGVYLWEHRRRGAIRRCVVHVGA